ncbi:MAG: L-threonylcarbamoyladenylate synthase [Pleurocapsa minor HA4230-MV1]|jgi:L-threonylcarbamoyladenylate synthase|nr:L-threonylcarbamoyladenylate synthase [Pleurocapsa minor HA4230-MV1]
MVKVSQTELIAGAIAGKVVSFPTDTVPALAVKPELGNLIYQLKRRSANKPLILLGSSIDDLLPYITYNDAELAIWQEIIQQHLPGALTLVLPASDRVPQAINPIDTDTVGIRIPNCPTALEILSQTGVLATSSANISGQDALRTMKAIEQAFPSVLVLENMDLTPGSGLPSTVVIWQEQQWKIIRKGSIVITDY